MFRKNCVCVYARAWNFVYIKDDVNPQSAWCYDPLSWLSYSSLTAHDRGLGCFMVAEDLASGPWLKRAPALCWEGALVAIWGVLSQSPLWCSWKAFGYHGIQAIVHSEKRRFREVGLACDVRASEGEPAPNRAWIPGQMPFLLGLQIFRPVLSCWSPRSLPLTPSLPLCPLGTPASIWSYTDLSRAAGSGGITARLTVVFLVLPWPLVKGYRHHLLLNTGCFQKHNQACPPASALPRLG